MSPRRSTHRCGGSLRTPASRAASSSTACATRSRVTGLNAATGEYVDLLAEGIIDPARVTRSALENAASIAALLLTTEATVVDKPAEEDEAAHAGHDHGMGGMGGMGGMM